MHRLTSPLALLVCVLALVACEEGAQHAQQEIIQTHARRVQEIVRDDLQRGVRGVEQAGTKLARGFLVEDPERRQREMRTALHLLRQPPRGIQELMISPISFVAAVDANGIVVARDAEPDPMAGFDAGEAFPMVRRALQEGWSGYELEEFPALIPDQPPSQTVLYVAPARTRDGRIVGAVLAGTPLWRTAQRVGRQLQADQASEISEGLILWVYLYRGDQLHHHGTPADLDTIVPDAAARNAGFARSPGGFTGEVAQFGRWYAYGVVPLPRIADDVGAVIFRSDPP
ncbi:hypothetical protein [Sandaracinus amylolyticus]|nr:hypothetical protein [Sandaracinus amylolyticus]